MKPIYLLIIIVLLSLIFLLNKPKPKEITFSALQPIAEIEKPSINSKILEFNDKNKKINSIYYPKIKILSNGVRLSSNLLYEKDLNFRTTTFSILGKESDIGSNSENFWFWVRTINPPALFYAKHKDLNKTRLKEVFSPDWVKEITGINEINTTNTEIMDYQSRIAVIQKRKSPVGRDLIKIYIIRNGVLQEHYLYDSQHKPIVSVVVKEFWAIESHQLPKMLEINWFEEGISSSWYLEKPLINLKISDSNWEIPNINPKINLNGYVP